MVDTLNSSPNTQSQSRIPKGKMGLVIFLVLGLLVGAGAGYYLGDKKSKDKVTELNKTVTELNKKSGEAELKATYASERFYYNDSLDFALIFPDHWVKNVSVVSSPSSADFVFRQEKSEYQSVLIVYKCPNSDYDQFKGQSADLSKCPGELIKRDDAFSYTWKQSTTKHTFISELGDSDKIASDFKNLVLPTFQIVK